MYLQAYNNFRARYKEMRTWASQYASSEFSDDREVTGTEVKNLNWSVPMGHLDEENITGEGLPPKHIMEKYGDCIDFFFDVILHLSNGRKNNDHRLICYFADEDYCQPQTDYDKMFRFVFEIR